MAAADAPARAFGRSARTETVLTPPSLSSLPAERDQLEFSSRSLVFPRDGDGLLRAWGPTDRPVVLGVEEDGARWRVRAWGTGPSAARAAVRSLFSLRDPLAGFYRWTARDPTLAEAARDFRGLRIPRDAGLYEALVHSVLGQQLSVRAATTIKARLFERTGAVIEAEGVEVPRVPTPGEIARLGEAGLRAVGASGAKARALLALAQREAAGAFGSRRFRGRSLPVAIARLDAEPGVGRWTAENALWRGLGRRDVFLAGDLGLRAALDAYGVVPRAHPEAAARAWADRRYPGWGSYATLYLWRRSVRDLASRRAAAGAG